MGRHSAVVAALALLLLPGCEPRAGGSGADALYRGRVLQRPVPRPSFTLTDTRGRPFDFREETEGKLTFLFFGYTHCPDVCPVHMANLSAVLEERSWEERQQVEVVFVSVDPARDSLPRIRSWLDNFSSEFVGLRGTRDEVTALERSLLLPSSAVGTDEETGEPFVAHATLMLAFTADDTAHVGYPFGTRQMDLAHDLPRLLEGWRAP